MYHFRKANSADKDILLEWINEPLTRQMSLNDNFITQEEHNIWFANSLEKGNTELFMYEEILDNGERNSVANIRVDKNKDRKYLSWNVSGEMRNKGIGGRMLREFTLKFKNNYFAIIKDNNNASISICSKSGFRKYYSRDEITYWKNF